MNAEKKSKSTNPELTDTQINHRELLAQINRDSSKYTFSDCLFVKLIIRPQFIVAMDSEGDSIVLTKDLKARTDEFDGTASMKNRYIFLTRWDGKHQIHTPDLKESTSWFDGSFSVKKGFVIIKRTDGYVGAFSSDLTVNTKWSKEAYKIVGDFFVVTEVISNEAYRKVWSRNLDHRTEQLICKVSVEGGFPVLTHENGSLTVLTRDLKSRIRVATDEDLSVEKRCIAVKGIKTWKMYNHSLTLVADLPILEGFEIKIGDCSNGFSFEHIPIEQPSEE